VLVKPGGRSIKLGPTRGTGSSHVLNKFALFERRNYSIGVNSANGLDLSTSAGLSISNDSQGFEGSTRKVHCRIIAKKTRNIGGILRGSYQLIATGLLL
tara:strand:+ start:533 stop:829 length:297 start_codon:yes stop_codon:yes gene_type:complete